MSTDPDRIREDIERTRAELSSDVDALTDKVSPTRVAQRQAEYVREGVTRVKDRVMGGISDGTDAVGSSVGSAAGSIGDAASNLPQATRSSARGNPLAAGLVAFGLGWLVASLLPSTRQEQQVARSAQDQARPLIQ